MPRSLAIAGWRGAARRRSAASHSRPCWRPRATVAALSDAPARKRVDVVNTPTTIGRVGTDPLPKDTLLLAVDDNAHVLALDAQGEPV
jgi:hypothetical protein